MQLIPVMDLQSGLVVHAVAGERSKYGPIRSALAGSAQPATVLRALLGLARFPAIYIADLDAITGAGSDRHFDLLAELCVDLAAAATAELWLDAGTAGWLPDLGVEAAARGVRLVPVLGSESFADAAALASRTAQLADFDCVLSLDYRGGKFLGPPGLDARAADWPSRVIVMELSGVGVGGGPPLAGIERVATAARNGGRSDIGIYAAGGVHDAGDLRLLACCGSRGVLLASALHDGRIDAQSLGEFTAKT